MDEYKKIKIIKGFGWSIGCEGMIFEVKQYSPNHQAYILKGEEGKTSMKMLWKENIHLIDRGRNFQILEVLKA